MTRSAPIEPPATPLTDGTVALRPRRESDVESIAAASHDPEIRRWLDDEPMDAQARRDCVARGEDMWRSGKAAPLVIADASTDEPVGSINLQFRSDTVATVAYGVFPQRRGQGVAPRAVRLLARWALTDLGLARLILEADEANLASIRVAEKAGFHRTGTRTEPAGDGDRRTIVVFALGKSGATG
ncbi:GNAT family N-acetyltransferase [Micromonospora sp. DR5-3]|uniref:GNAT family N-acetyltransferase n=1 Tax=unclassified Micromonospora TaxID=2617518 RepID=UPI0011D672F0|nr:MULTISPECIES: GNAT family protein [unclassified Micromonospora]MCW3816582.1 GNAT family N-acetyltransferase [Micromonospora sp. DR5-3]TYC20228.1 GNAT family N-acetyltransferase [Micromonospora sp. MP36]